MKNGKSSLSHAEKYIYADQTNKKYLFNKEKFMDETNATSKDVREIESDLQTTNHDIKTRIMLDMKMVTSLDMSVL